MDSSGNTTRVGWEHFANEEKSPEMVYSEENAKKVEEPEVLISKSEEDAMSKFFDRLHQSGKSLLKKGTTLSVWENMALNDDVVSRILIGVSLMALIKRNVSFYNVGSLFELVLALFYPIIYVAMVSTEYFFYKKK